ncbi:type VI secretion system Vgr family protein [Rhizobium mayense]|uniref:Type VI secretion system tip protein TssI/VgrG n=1 Tax=Rhizobium mayense TaxID=1312184 RepID=A0ABT7JUH5_9HYPH|nr:type VI secretion system tip protein TssI/VgrG [Rhizobium mayense]MDL2398843.1 type VI secretion system tip protein TssI/VgrG [Rhizobium mayense]
MSTNSMQEMLITLPGTTSDVVYVESVRGRETLSSAYEFEADVVCRTPLQIEPMLGKAAKLELRVLDEEAVVHGIVAAATTLDPTTNREFCYRFVIAPELALMKLSRQNQIYGTDRDMNVVDIVEKELSDGNKSGSKTASSRVGRSIPHQILADKSSYPKLDFTMQYNESDFDFVSRLCEKFGIFYMFDQSGDQEVVQFCDRKEHFRRVSGRKLTEELPFRGEAQIRSQGDFAIRSFKGTYKVSAGSIHRREFNDETPTVDLSVSHDATYSGQGIDVRYDENYRTVGEGNFLATRRMEQVTAERLTFVGESNIPLLRPGMIFKLVDHPIAELEAYYVITHVEHEMAEPTPLGFSSTDKKSEPYRNRFTCIPFSTQYRPPLLTPRPVVNGFLIGFVDGEGSSKRAELDQYGRYRIRIMDEESGLSGGKASYLVRKVEPYGGGDGFGSHSTLNVGTEVILGFLHGDPDRPVIAGAFSNAHLSNPVTQTNSNVAHRTRTASGIILQMCDGAAR